jgi:hypothetical protein
LLCRLHEFAADAGSSGGASAAEMNDSGEFTCGTVWRGFDARLRQHWPRAGNLLEINEARHRRNRSFPKSFGSRSNSPIAAKPDKTEESLTTIMERHAGIQPACVHPKKFHRPRVPAKHHVWIKRLQHPIAIPASASGGPVPETKVPWSRHQQPKPPKRPGRGFGSRRASHPPNHQESPW